MGTPHVCNRNVIYWKNSLYGGNSCSCSSICHACVSTLLQQCGMAELNSATPMMWAVGGIALFSAAGAGGVVNSAMPLDFSTHDSYWVVGHFPPLCNGYYCVWVNWFCSTTCSHMSQVECTMKLPEGTLLLSFCRYNIGVLYTTRTWFVRNAKKSLSIIRQSPNGLLWTRLHLLVPWLLASAWQSSWQIWFIVQLKENLQISMTHFGLGGKYYYPIWGKEPSPLGEWNEYRNTTPNWRSTTSSIQNYCS